MQVPVVAVVRPALGMWNVPGSNCSRLRWPTGDASTVPIRSRAPHSPPSPGTRRPIGGWVPDPAAYYCFPVDSASRASAWAARKNLLRPRSPMVSTLNACCNAAASASETPARALTGALRISSWNLPSPADASRRVCARGAAAHRRIRRRTRRRTRRRDAAVAPLPRPLASRSQRRRGAGRAIRGAAHLREPPKCHQGRQPAGSHAPVRDGAPFRRGRTPHHGQSAPSLRQSHASGRSDRWPIRRPVCDPTRRSGVRWPGGQVEPSGRDVGEVLVDLRVGGDATGDQPGPEPGEPSRSPAPRRPGTVSYTHLRAHETVLDLVCRLLLEKKKKTNTNNK